MGKDDYFAGAPRVEAARGRIFISSIVAGVWLAIGIMALSAFPWSLLAVSVQSTFWPRVEARLHAHELVHERRNGARHRMDESLLIVANYSYTANGAEHSGTRVSLMDRGATDDRRLKSLHHRLEFASLTGRRVEVAYDPRNPAHAYIDPAFPWREVIVQLAIGLFFSWRGMVRLSRVVDDLRPAASPVPRRSLWWRRSRAL